MVGTEEQKKHWQKTIIEGNLFVGGAVNPRDNDLSITDAGDHLVFDGFKNFNTGGVISDWTVLEGAYAGAEHHVFAFVPTNQLGTQFAASNLTEYMSLVAWLTLYQAQLEQYGPSPH